MPDDSLNILSIQNKKDWIDFVKFPYRLYKNNPCWVPPILMDYKVLLNPDKHPFYRHADEVRLEHGCRRQVQVRAALGQIVPRDGLAGPVIVAPVGDDGLRAALERLGRNVLSKSKG